MFLPFILPHTHTHTHTNPCISFFLFLCLSIFLSSPSRLLVLLAFFYIPPLSPLRYSLYAPFTLYPFLFATYITFLPPFSSPTTSPSLPLFRGLYFFLFFFFFFFFNRSFLSYFSCYQYPSPKSHLRVMVWTLDRSIGGENGTRPYRKTLRLSAAAWGSRTVMRTYTRMNVRSLWSVRGRMDSQQDIGGLEMVSHSG